MEIEAGKSYHIKTPHGEYNKPPKVHIDYILDDPTLADFKNDPNYDEHKLVVYRIWLKYKGYWGHYVDKYYSLCIYNDWKWSKK
jgi:hypothetical protein